jgi:hypothetical protein
LSQLLHRLQNLAGTRLCVSLLYRATISNPSNKSYSGNSRAKQLLHISYPPLSSADQPLPITMAAAQIFTVFAGILALAGAYLYFFGIDPETKRALERKALQTMGENKMSYMAKGASTDLIITSHY